MQILPIRVLERLIPTAASSYLQNIGNCEKIGRLEQSNLRERSPRRRDQSGTGQRRFAAGVTIVRLLAVTEELLIARSP
jgi:hypothetical protein